MALTLKSIDTMKTSRDSGAITSQQKIDHINAIVSNIPDLTHIAIGCYADNFGYQSLAYIKEWFDAVHNVGKKVLFRPALTGATTTGTPAEKTANFQTNATNLTTCWADGDAWDVWPEVGISAFSNDVPTYNQFVRDTITALQSTFTTMEKDVDVTFWSGTDQMAIFNSRYEAETVTAMGNKICIDCYPMDYIGSPGKGSTHAKVMNLINQLASARSHYPTADIYITETGYNNTTLVSEENQREVIRVFLNEIRNVSYIKGLNYWHAAGNTEFDKCLVFQDDSLTVPRPALAMLGEFYTKGVCNRRVRVL